MEILLHNFVISFFTLTYVLLDELIPFYRKQFSPSLNKTGKLQVSHCIFQSVYALNTRSIKLLRRSVVKVLIILLIKQLYATY